MAFSIAIFRGIINQRPETKYQWPERTLLSFFSFALNFGFVPFFTFAVGFFGCPEMLVDETAAAVTSGSTVPAVLSPVPSVWRRVEDDAVAAAAAAAFAASAAAMASCA